MAREGSGRWRFREGGALLGPKLPSETSDKGASACLLSKGLVQDLIKHDVLQAESSRDRVEWLPQGASTGSFPELADPTMSHKCRNCNWARKLVR